MAVNETLPARRYQENGRMWTLPLPMSAALGLVLPSRASCAGVATPVG